MKIGTLRRLLLKVPKASFVRNGSACSYSTYNNGDKIHGYQIKRVTDVPEFSMTAIELEHLKTKAKHFHLIRDDKNNVFNVSLQTTPMNSTGVAHVLEHVVLCGSEKYPVRDPFFKMLDRSMSTFMNAMTGPDYTMYPFSTQNPNDFKNLMSVYLDSVFFPQIRKMDFLQEGWRLEHENNKDVESPIVFKGVVFNEMKGMLSDPSYLFGTAMQNHILPDHTYGVCSGGKPDKILDLTWEDLRDFHAKHYHPSNANFFTYGDLPLEGHLEQIDSQVMSRFEAIEPQTKVPLQKKWNKPRSVEVRCPHDELASNPDKQTSFAVSFLLPEVSDVDQVFTSIIVCALLMDGPSSPFYKSLIESGLGSNYSPQAGYHGHQREAVFSIGLQALAPSDVGKVRDLIDETTRQAAKDGFPRDRVDAILHQVELQQKHQSSRFGLGMGFNLMPTWQHGADPTESLKVDQIVAKFRKKIDDDPEFLKRKCEQYFTNNNHRLELTMSPDQDFKRKSDEQELRKLEGRTSDLDPHERKEVFKQGEELSFAQQQVDDVSCLPTLCVTDIPRQQQNYDVTLRHLDVAPLLVTCCQPTNGVAYFDAMFPANQLSEELKPYLPIFADVITKMGTRSTDYVTMSQREERFTGGLSATVTSQCGLEDPMTSETGIHLHSHCLDRNGVEMLDLWREIINQVVFDDLERLKTLIGQSAQDLTNSVSFNGHVFAMRSAAKHLAPSAGYNEMFSGLTQVNFINSIAESPDQISDVAEKLRHIARHVLCNDVTETPRFALHATPEAMTSFVTSVNGLIEDLPKGKKQETYCNNFMSSGELCAAPSGGIQSLVKWNEFESRMAGKLKCHHSLPLAVNFVSLGIRTGAPYAHGDAPALRVLARLMSAKYLHREIREMGGAYGGGAKQGDDGVFRFFTYRDPNNVRSLERFHDSVEWARGGNFDAREISEAKLAVFQTVDSPLSPFSRGLPLFTTGLNDVIRQKHRDRLLDVTKEQLVEVASRYLAQPSYTCAAVIGPNHSDLKEFAHNG